MRTPTTAEVEAIAEEVGVSFGAGEAKRYTELLAGYLITIEDVADLPKSQLAPRDYTYTDRVPLHAPSADS